LSTIDSEKEGDQGSGRIDEMKDAGELPPSHGYEIELENGVW
jgi:hypothetical protein